ncbi:MAG: [citrate (pro-3S)-lyase] ligase [Sulfurospirillum sp.]
MSFVFSEVPYSSVVRRQKVRDFLESVDLEMSEDVETFVIAKEDDRIVACGGLSGRVLKNIALDESIRGEGLALSLMSELLKLAFREGRHDLFLFTKPEYEEVFESCGFKYIEQANHQVILMENSYNIDLYKKRLRKYKHTGDVVGSIVMNCNPFTLGHRYLVEQACERSHWVHLFVVKEDASFFSYKDRYKLICEGLEDLKNLTIHEGSDYIISKATFPTYFIKDKRQIDSLYTELDLNIFRNHLAPQLGITHRYVGEEPLCVVTNEYNEQMKKLLAAPSEFPPIEVVVLGRIEYGGEPISASRVRRLMQENRLEEIIPLVPPTTYALIEKMMSKEEAK